jgi:hypothetical protein
MSPGTEDGRRCGGCRGLPLPRNQSASGKTDPEAGAASCEVLQGRSLKSPPPPTAQLGKGNYLVSNMVSKCVIAFVRLDSLSRFGPLNPTASIVPSTDLPDVQLQILGDLVEIRGGGAHFKCTGAAGCDAMRCDRCAALSALAVCGSGWRWKGPAPLLRAGGKKMYRRGFSRAAPATPLEDSWFLTSGHLGY